MQNETFYIDMNTLRLVSGNNKSYVTKYQLPNCEVREFQKDGKWWSYIDHLGNEIECDSLKGAKGDILYSGGKVWREKV